MYKLQEHDETNRTALSPTKEETSSFFVLPFFFFASHAFCFSRISLPLSYRRLLLVRDVVLGRHVRVTLFVLVLVDIVFVILFVDLVLSRSSARGCGCAGRGSQQTGHGGQQRQRRWLAPGMMIELLRIRRVKSGERSEDELVGRMYRALSW